MFSCESDDDNGLSLTNATLAGTYNVTAITGSGSESNLLKSFVIHRL